MTTLAPVPDDDRIADMVDAWKRKLLDLTRRNRALNFKPTRVSTILVTNEQPAEIFRRLCLRELPMRFRALEPATAASEPEPDPSAIAAGLPDPFPGDDEIDDTAATSPDFVPYDVTALGEKQTDEWLQTSSSPEALDKSLRRIDELALIATEEQGVNTLFLTLGMLTYGDPEDPDGVFRAPLVMLPVALTRKSARAGYSVRATEDEPLANPALGELLRREHGIVLPEFPSSDALAEDFDLQTYFSDVIIRIRAVQPSWAVKSDVTLALFAFQKLVMYKDLEANAGPASSHRLVRQLATREGSTAVGLPMDVRSLDLDAAFPPEATFQVVDADSSQLRAIATVARQHDLVIEGPPGTGKSQTITNLIATALAAGKSVLFVAEKQAALSVVHQRLVAAGLGEFCLELHSTKANKRAVLRQVGAALDASLQPVAVPSGATQNLPAARAALTDYARAVHTPFNALGWSPFRVYGEFSRVLSAPRLPFDQEVDGVTESQLHEAGQQLAALAAAAGELGPPASHPWRDARRAFYLPTDLEEIADLGAGLAPELAALDAAGVPVAARFGLPPLTSFVAVERAAATGALLARSPGVPLAILESAAWDQPPAEALALIRRGRELAALRAKIEAIFEPGVLEQEHAGDCAFIEQMLSGRAAFLAFLNGRFRAIKRRWRSYRKAGYNKPLTEQAGDLRLVDRLKAERADLDAQEPLGRSLFGARWQGGETDWDALERMVSWVVEFRRAGAEEPLDVSRAAVIAAEPSPDVTPIRELTARAGRVRKMLGRFVERVGWADDTFAEASFADIGLRVEAVGKSTVNGPRWAAFEAARQAAVGGIAAEFVAAGLAGRIAFPDLGAAFRRAFYARWLGTCLRHRPSLERFHALSHDKRVAEFRALDVQVLRENRARLVSQLRDRVQDRLKAPDAAAGMPVLRRELARQRAHQPLRRTLQEAEAAIRAIKPCFMMSPLTVAQYLDGRAPSFDLVIFDEASQLPAEDAAGAIIRGRQLVVVGDPKQLPPTAFFAGSIGTGRGYADDDAAPEPDAESVLEEFMGAGVPMSRLKWHYRSAHESLINFSNVSFYDAELFTFPSIATGTQDDGLQFEFVPGGIYEGKGLNLAEARRVAEAVVEFAREQQERRARGERAQSLGVGTFNLRQQLAIQDELEARRRAEPGLEPFFDRSAAEPFFVKNLENIQGDERDVVFLSVTYARAADGRLRHNFGPLNGENGWRRLNVLTTRARQRMKVFASMRGDEISVGSAPAHGARLLREFLLFAERGRLERGTDGAGDEAGNEFVRDLARELSRRGLKVLPHVGSAGYRIDLALVDDALPGRFLCGIECDGTAYHASETARDRDRLRQEVLEARGWTLFRAWSTAWFLDRQGQIERLSGLLEQVRRRLGEELAALRDARQQAEEEASATAGADAENSPPGAPDTSRREANAYIRPVATPYEFAASVAKDGWGELLSAPDRQVVNAVVAVIETEAPIHQAELCARVAGPREARSGARGSERILAAATKAAAAGLVRRRGEFWWRKDGRCVVRSRAGVRMAADRIAPEEYTAAVLLILGQGHGFAREQLVAEVRSVLGYARIGAALDESVRAAVDDLLRENKLGEGSTGIKIRVTG